MNSVFSHVTILVLVL